MEEIRHLVGRNRGQDDTVTSREMYLLLLTYSKEQSPSWEANRFSASQEIPRILWNTKVHYCIHKCPPPVPILNLPRGLFPSCFPSKTLYTPLLSSIRATCPAHLILPDFITRTILGEEYRSPSSSLCSFLYTPVTSSLLGPNIGICTLSVTTVGAFTYFDFITSNRSYRHWIRSVQPTSY